MAKTKSSKGGKGAGRAASKQSKKFVASGQLASAIKDRKRKQDVRRKIDNRKALRGKSGQTGYGQQHDDDRLEGDEGVAASVSKAKDRKDEIEDEEEDSGDEM